MSTRRTLQSVESEQGCLHIYEETLETPLLKEGHVCYYPIHIEIDGPRGQEINIRLADKLSIEFVKQMAGF